MAHHSKTQWGCRSYTMPLAATQAGWNEELAAMPEQVVWFPNGSVSLLPVRNCEAPTSGRIASATSLQKTVIHRFTERRLIQAYLKLFLAAQDEDGSKTVSLARFGSYEVRVIELWHDASASGFPVWLELYEHDTHSTLDSCGCSELEEAVAAADELISQARQLCRVTTQA
jgi:hypothetical protein